jgi:hypothetical protein
MVVCSAGRSSNDPTKAAPKMREGRPVKSARILDGDQDTFTLEYDNTLGRKNRMRLDAATYEKAIREAKSYLGIKEDNHDEHGDLWEVE